MKRPHDNNQTSCPGTPHGIKSGGRRGTWVKTCARVSKGDCSSRVTIHSIRCANRIGLRFEHQILEVLDQSRLLVS